MLYNWSGKPYRSKHVDVAAVKVTGFWTIRISRDYASAMSYEYGMEHAQPLHETEGFESRGAMDDWFRPLVHPGETLEKSLMLFALLDTWVCGWRGMAGGKGCTRPLGHAGGHRFNDGAGCRASSCSGSLAGRLLAFIKVNHQRGTFADMADMQLHEALAPYEAEFAALKNSRDKPPG